MQPELAPPEAACSLNLMQRELLQKQPPPLQNRSAPSAGAPPEAASSLYRAAPCSQSELPQKQAPPSAPYCESSSRISLLPSTIKQPRSAGARQKQPPPSLYRAAPRSRSPSKKSDLLHNRAAPRSRSPPKKSALLHNRAAPCSGSSPRSSLLTAFPCTIEQQPYSFEKRETPPPPPPPPPFPETDSSLFQAEGGPWKFGGRKGSTSTSVDAL